MEYLKMTRKTGYVKPKGREKLMERQSPCDLNANLAEPLLQSRPIGNDESLVRDYFLNIFQRAATQNLGDIGVGMMSPYTDYVRSTWLKPVLAEALITSGQG